MHDVSEAVLDRCGHEQASMLDQQIETGVVPRDKRPTILNRLRFTGSLSEAAVAADLVIEAVREDLNVKREVFRALDEICPPHTILATNSSSLRVSRIESATNRPDKVLNTHFIQSVWKHPFVELMRGTKTSDETLEAVRQFVRSIGLVPILVRREVTGFILARVWRAVKKEALHLVDSGAATPEDVDRAWMVAMEAPLGPFALMDRIGLDVIRDIEQVYFEESGDASDAPPKVLLDKIEKGELGVKTGKGFYTYPAPAYASAGFLRDASGF
jgi:3-hydroxybutyryl-CoA dehydrogenase